MRITFVLPNASLNGGTRVVAIHASALARMGHVVRLVSVPLPAVRFRRKLKSFLLGNGWPADPAPARSHLDGRGLDHGVLERWRPILDDDVPDADVVIATWWETAEWVNALKSSKGAKVYFVQGHEVFPYLPIERCHATYRLPLHKIVIARWLKDVMRVQYGDDTVDLVPNSVDRSQFFAEVRGKAPVPTVGTLYSVVPFKGFALSVSATDAVRARFPGLRMICFGMVDPHASMPLPEYAEFFRSPPQDKLRDLYAQCDVWITASRSEGFNLPALEAMACRTPVVATRTGWPEEVLETGKNGVLADIDDVAALARGLDWVLSHSDENWRGLSQRAYETACLGSWEESSRRFEQALIHACHRSLRGEISGRCGVSAILSTPAKASEDVSFTAPGV